MNKKEMIYTSNGLKKAIDHLKNAHQHLTDLCDDKYIDCLDDQLDFIKDRLEEIRASLDDEIEWLNYREEDLPDSADCCENEIRDFFD